MPEQARDQPERLDPSNQLTRRGRAAVLPIASTTGRGGLYRLRHLIAAGKPTRNQIWSTPRSLPPWRPRDALLDEGPHARPDHRSSPLLTLTPRGREALTEVTTHAAAVHRKLFARLSNDEIHQSRAFLRKLLGELDRWEGIQGSR